MSKELVEYHEYGLLQAVAPLSEDGTTCPRLKKDPVLPDIDDSGSMTRDTQVKVEHDLHVKWAWYIIIMYSGTNLNSLGPKTKRAIALHMKATIYKCML